MPSLDSRPVYLEIVASVDKRRGYIEVDEPAVGPVKRLNSALAA
jgi:hypothetical protein